MKDYFLLLMERAGEIGSINKIANIIGSSHLSSKDSGINELQ
jgi:hypothetical protein